MATKHDLNHQGLPGLYQESFSKEILSARRVIVSSQLENSSMAIIQGAPRPSGSVLFRQTNDMYYLSGVAVPHAYLTISGQNNFSILYLPHLNPDAERDEGKSLNASKNTMVTELVGVDSVRPLEALPHDLSLFVLKTNKPKFFTPMRSPELGSESRDGILKAIAYSLADPWRESVSPPSYFINKLKGAFPEAVFADLSPILDAMREQKDTREIEVLRIAGELCAQGITEAMRSTMPGIFEYQLAAVASFLFNQGGARGEGYRAIVASGKNAWHGHYGKLNSELTDGELVLMDFAPDFAYYTSDIGRMWPVNGKFSSEQRTLYSFIVKYHRSLLEQTRPGRVPNQIMDDVAARMSKVIDETKFANDSQKQAASKALDFRGHFSHPVGMSVHDIGEYRSRPLSEGTVFSVDPMMWIEDEKSYIRCEDTVVITKDGYENLTSSAPLDCDQIEDVMKEPGILQKLHESTKQEATNEK